MLTGEAPTDGLADGRSDGFDEVIARIDAAHARVGAAQRAWLELIGEVDATGAWAGDGARDLAHWLGMRYGISTWKARRLVGAARALEGLPRIADALGSGTLSLDKVAELCRFATPENEQRLCAWARGVACWAIRRRADREHAAALDPIAAHEQRQVSWWYHDAAFELSALLPAEAGAAIVTAIERMAERVPVMPGEPPAPTAPARRADALVAICSAQLADDPDPDRASVVVHLSAAGSTTTAGRATGEIEHGPVLHPATVARLACDARVQSVEEDEDREVITASPMRREPSTWMLRQLRHRDTGCRFPGCGTTAFTHAHHLVWWSEGGATELGNLALVCSFHHRLVHEHGWSLSREAGDELVWRRPDGSRYEAGPAP